MKMPKFNQICNVNILCICVVIIYNIYFNNYAYVQLILHKLNLSNYTHFIILINIIGLHLFLKHIQLEVKLIYEKFLEDIHKSTLNLQP